MATITWLHFSDLHLCHPKSGWEADYILEKLQEDLNDLHDESGTPLIPDLIFFTGDSVFGHLGENGGMSITEQFQEAATFFERIRTTFAPPIPIENVFLVPGNHDVNRSEVSEWMHNGFEQSLKNKDYANIEKELNSLLQNGGKDWQGFIKRLSDYRQFLKATEYKHLLQDEKHLIYADKRCINGIEVGIAGLNSVWSCYQDDEKGQLWLGGHWQIQTLSKNLKSADLKIVLMHHPVNWMNQVEDPFIMHELENHFQFFLHGHEHQNWVTENDRLIRIGAGACYGDAESETGYNIVQLDSDTGVGKVWLRKYDRSGGCWIPRIIGKRTDNNGIWKIHCDHCAPQNSQEVEAQSNRKEQPIQGKQASSIPSIPQLSKVEPPQKAIILILVANPKDVSRLRLDEEVREIEEGLQRSQQRDTFDIKSRWAVSLRGLRRALLDYKPQIVHFAGHGNLDGLKFEDESGKTALVKPEAMAGLFKLFPQIECVLLNACYSEAQAQAIYQYIPYVIGMNSAVRDKAALEFAIGFYDALGAGKSFEDAFEFGKNALELFYPSEKASPVLNGESSQTSVSDNDEDSLLRGEELPEQKPKRFIDFVNRTHELQFITSIHCPLYLLLSAPSGYGKTRLLETICNHLQQKNWLCLYLDLAGAKPYTPDELMDIFLQQLGKENGAVGTFTTLAKVGHEIGMHIFRRLQPKEQRKVILLIDTIEARDEDWNKDFFNQCIPAIQNRLHIADKRIQIRVILTGRYASQLKQLSTALPLEVMSLSPFDYSAVHQTVQEYSTKNEIAADENHIKNFAAHVMHFTGGHPGCMANILLQDFEKCLSDEMPNNENRYYTDCIKPVISEIEACIPRSLKTIFETLSVVRRFNPRLLRHFSSNGLITRSNNEFQLEGQLLQTHLVKREKNGFLKDDITRRLLAIHLCKTRFSDFVNICKEATTFYMARLKDPRCLNPGLITIEILFQQLQLCYDRPYSKQQFLDKLIEIIKIAISNRDLLDSLGIINGIKKTLEEDWEIRFMFNYIYREDSYDAQHPFNELLEKLTQFQQDLQGGNSHG